MNASAVAHFISGGIMAVWGLKDLGGSRYISTFSPPKNEFLYTHGFSIAAIVIGIVLVGAGVMTLRGKDPEPPEGGTAFVWDMPPIFGFIAGIPVTIFAGLCIAAIVPYVGQRGFVAGQILTALFLFLLMGALAFLLLHYRRTTILDPSARRIEIAFGKPFIFHRKELSFTDYDSVGMQITYGKGGSRFFRAMAWGEGKNPMLMAVTTVEAEGHKNLDLIAQITGWTKAAE